MVNFGGILFDLESMLYNEILAKILYHIWNTFSPILMIEFYIIVLYLKL